ncbi:MAG: homoserine kinase, partial [Rectinema sp.]|nr:homoserine kinase [Rectinema sp.]
GPGFDCLGLALSLYNIFRVRISDTTVLKGIPEQFQGEDNLFLRSFRYAWNALPPGDIQSSVPAIEVEFETGIPPARGLGSSAALSVAGAAAALQLSRIQNKAHASVSENKEDRLQSICMDEHQLRFIFDVAANIEGHPDNAAPAVYGGFTAAARTEHHTTIMRSVVSPQWLFLACIPDFCLETAVARAVLPQQYSRSDTVHAIAHATLTALAIREGNLTALGEACEDRIHQPFRSSLIPGYDHVMEVLRKAGAAAAWLSGSGPSIIGVFEVEPQRSGFEKAGRIPVSDIADELGSHWQLKALSPDNAGLQLRMQIKALSPENGK